MANELKDALTQLKKDVATLAGVTRAQKGQVLTALPETTHNKSVAAIYLLTGAPDNAAYTSTTEEHRVEIRFYWRLTQSNVEDVEDEMASMWDRVMTKFYGDDPDRNLTENATCVLVGGGDGDMAYTAAYEQVAQSWHRVLTVPVEIILDTHSV